MKALEKMRGGNLFASRGKTYLPFARWWWRSTRENSSYLKKGLWEFYPFFVYLSIWIRDFGISDRDHASGTPWAAVQASNDKD